MANDLRWRLGLWRSRAANRAMDIAAVLAGYCNDRPWSPIPGEGGGGYSHWRCAHRRGHQGLHRFRNYVWADDRRVVYTPERWTPSQPWKRNIGARRADDRAAIRWHKEQVALRASRRG